MISAEVDVSTRRIWSVSALCRSVADTLDVRLNPVRVGGEVGSFVQASSGHCYFNLKDSDAQLRCVMFRRASLDLPRLPRDGDRVELLGRMGVYAARGDIQLVVDQLRPYGQGAVMEQFLRLKSKLEGEGLFRVERKRPLPAFSKTIGLVTSPDAAAMADVLATLSRRAPNVRVLLSPCLVQGVGAESTIVDALQALYGRCVDVGASTFEGPDVILLVRGGGAWEDLHAFNDERVARCIAQSPVPLVCGVGHETDFTIADFVADVRAATPTAAAELGSVAVAELLDRLQESSNRLGNAIKRRMEMDAQTMDWLSAALWRPSEWVSRRRPQLDALAESIGFQMALKSSQARPALLGLEAAFFASGEQGLRVMRTSLEEFAIRLKAANPENALARGFAWLHREGRLISSVEDVSEGELISATLADGVVELQVRNIVR